jgi:Integron cassette protein VCH_CASS1 chain
MLWSHDKIQCIRSATVPLTVADLDTLESYLAGVIDRSDHHAQTVGAIALALIGAVLWKKDSEPIEVRTQDGSAKNVLWVHISGHRYALAYNHAENCIELRDRTLRGDALARFTNDTPVTEVYRIFERL